MRTEHLPALILLVPFLSCACEADAQANMHLQRREHPPELHERSAVEFIETFGFDIVHESCALYVAVRSRAFEVPVAFGRDLDDVPLHWNKCPGGEMVACKVTPTAKGDTIITGVPFPY